MTLSINISLSFLLPLCPSSPHPSCSLMILSLIPFSLPLHYQITRRALSNSSLGDPCVSLLGPSLLPSFSGVVDYSLVILCFMFNIHLWVCTYNACLSESELPHLVCFFLVPSICLQILICHCFYCWVVLHWVNVSHFDYPYFSWGAYKCFQVLAITNNAARNIVVNCPCGVIEYP